MEFINSVDDSKSLDAATRISRNKTDLLVFINDNGFIFCPKDDFN